LVSRWKTMKAAVAGMTGATVGTVSAELAIVTGPLAVAVLVFAFLVVVTALAWVLRARRLAGASLRRGIPVDDPTTHLERRAAVYGEVTSAHFRLGPVVGLASSSSSSSSD
jgi:uncharacterized protein (DUF58 family)